MKLEKFALVADVMSAIAVVVTLIFVIVEIRANVEATLAANRQSLASRTEQLLATQSTSPQLAAVWAKARNEEELTVEETYLYSGHLGQIRRLAEEGYRQYLDGNLSSEYWQTRAANTVDSRMRNRYARELY